MTKSVRGGVFVFKTVCLRQFVNFLYSLFGLKINFAFVLVFCNRTAYTYRHMYAFFQKCLKYANLLRHKFVKTIYPYISVFVKFGAVFDTVGKMKKVVLAVGTATFFDVRKIFLQYV